MFKFRFSELFEIRTAPIASPGGKLSSDSETDEECGQQSDNYRIVSGFLLTLGARRSSSVTACAVPPSPRGKV